MTIADTWQVERLAASLGAEVIGVDLTTTTPNDIEAIQNLLLDHMVLFFPDQSISPEQHVAFGRYFGRLEGHPNLKNPTPYPEIFQLEASKGGVADEWHTDITFEPEPALMSIMHVLECPAVGGDTMWASLCEAYDQLSNPMKRLCDELTALHDAHPHNRSDKMAIHPVVRIHPNTGRRALYVNEHFTRRIVEMNSEESSVLLKHLSSWVTHPRFTVRYRWKPGTIAIWDNRCTQHFVLNDFKGERVIQRVTVMGDKPIGIQDSKWEPHVSPNGPSAMSRHDRQLHEFLKDKQKKEFTDGG